MTGITYGDHLIDSGYYDITPEQELDMSDHEEIEDCDDCEACKGTGTISWFDHAEGAWRDEHCTDCDGKGVKFTVRKVETRVGGGQAMSEPLSACPFTQRCLEIERLVERLRADAKDTAIALARQAEALREAEAQIERVKYSNQQQYDIGYAHGKSFAKKAEQARDELLEAIATLTVNARQAIDAGEQLIATLTVERDELREALLKARQFIENGIEFGFISLPEDKGDPAHDTLPAIRAALEAKP